MIPFSILDLSPINQGATPADALHNSLALARHAEQHGYRRFWLAEHHNMRGIASAATAVAIGYVAGGTEKIRVGSGGVMLPNHAPLVIAEQFGTLESLYPGRIDLGLGRAPGTDRATMRALRRDLHASADRFPQDVLELQSYFDEPQAGQSVRAVPGAGLRVPLWILGSSLFGAQLAAEYGLPFGFASHFAPGLLIEALHIYRGAFRASDQLGKPYAMPTICVIAAETDQEARRLFSSQQQAFLNLHRGTPGQLPPPVDDIAALCTPAEQEGLNQALGEAVVGSPATVAAGLRRFLEKTQADELMITVPVFDQAVRLRSVATVADILGGQAGGQ